MKKLTHKEVKFSAAEMADDGTDEIDFSRTRFVGRGREGLETSRRISRARGEEKRRLIESLPRYEDAVAARAKVQLDPDIAAVFKDSESVNKALRALIHAMPVPEKRKTRKTA